MLDPDAENGDREVITARVDGHVYELRLEPECATVYRDGVEVWFGARHQIALCKGMKTAGVPREVRLEFSVQEHALRQVAS